MGDPPLIDAAKRGNLKDFRSLLNNGVGDVDAKCRAEQASSLHWASYFGHIRMLQDLILKKANVNALHKKDDTPLHWAVVANQVDCVKLLLDADVNMDAQNNTGATAIVIAAKDGHSDIVYALLERGADVSIEANEGKSALDYARSKGHAEVVKLLEEEAHQPRAKLVFDLALADGHTHHVAVRSFFNRPRRFRTDPTVASAFLSSLERLMANGHADIAAETLLARYATVAQLWAPKHNDDAAAGAAVTSLAASSVRSPYRSPSRLLREISLGDDNEDVCSDDALELALCYSVFWGPNAPSELSEATAQQRHLLIECGKRYGNAAIAPADFVAVGDRNVMVLARQMLREDSTHLDKVLPVVKEFIQLQIDNAPPELLVGVVEAFRYTHRPSYMLALTAITCEPQFQLFSERMCEIIRAARDLAHGFDDGNAKLSLPTTDTAPSLPRREVRLNDAQILAARGAAERTDRAGPSAAGVGDAATSFPSPPRFVLSLTNAAVTDENDNKVAIRGGPVQRTAVLVELHQEADGVDPLFLVFGAAVAQRSGGVFDAPPRDPLRTLEASGLRPDGERQWQCESVCSVTRGTLKYGSVSKMTLGIELLLACDTSLAAISQLDTRLLGADAVAIEIVSVWNRFAEPTTGGWADVLVQFAFDADDNRHIVEVRLVHQDLALVAEEHNALGPYVKTRSALELLEAKGLGHRVPPPTPPQPQPESPSAAGRTTSALRRTSSREESLQRSPMMTLAPLHVLPAVADDRVGRLEEQLHRLESTVADQTRMISAQGEMIKQLLAHGMDRSASPSTPPSTPQHNMSCPSLIE